MSFSDGTHGTAVGHLILLTKIRLPPRVSLLTVSLFFKISGSVFSTVAIATRDVAFAIASATVCLFWFVLLFLAAVPSTDRLFFAHRTELDTAARTSLAVLILAGILEAAVVISVILGGFRGVGGELGTLLNSYQRIGEYGDATALQQQATENFLAGKNPYKEANVITAGMEFNVPATKMTPLRNGRFAGNFPYPDLTQIEKAYIDAQATPGRPTPEFTTEYSYPAGSFVLPAPFIARGINDLRIVFVLFLLPSLGYVLWQIRSASMRVYFVAALIASLELWHSVFSGGTNLLVFPFLLMAWIIYRKNLWLSALFLGIAIAAKQMAWFLLPFYFILVLREKGLRSAFLVGAMSGGVFLGFNLYYIVADPALWVHSMVAPMMNNLFPSNVWLIALNYVGIVRMQSSLPSTIAEVSVFVLVLAWYSLRCRRLPETALVLAVVPFFLAWRGSWGYLYYFDLILLASSLMHGAPPQPTSYVESTKVPLDVSILQT